MIRKYSILFIICFAFTICSGQKNLYKEKHRPQFHFTPSKNWINDPNGLLYFKGEYHLFYQYNPFGNRWGHMSWGHAVSNDLVHWKHLPIAIKEENKIMIFSGSAVADQNNTSGFADKSRQVPLVAVYTGHFISDTSDKEQYLQAQYIAFSLDNGRTWKKYPGNPVLDEHKKDFRDPKVFWYSPHKKWIMAVVLPHEHIVQFYGSDNLKQWQHLSDFGPAGDIKDIWECPDLLQVPVQGSVEKKKWVLFNSQQITMQYFVGEFDGTRFINENPARKIFRPDYGPDFYAAVTYNNLPAGHSPVLLGWANNWKYANDIPTTPWKSAMALPRQLMLQKLDNEWRLLQQPVTAIQPLRITSTELNKIEVSGKKLLPVNSQQVEIEIIFHPTAIRAGIRLAVGKDNAFIIGYDSGEQKLYIDRSKSGNVSFHKVFADLSRYEATLMPLDEKIRLHIFFDKSIIEIFANNGIAVMTVQLFPDEKNDSIELFSENGSQIFQSVTIHKLRSIWK